MEMDDPAFQIIVLGPTGGPKEDAVTGLLVRSTSTTWSKSSIVAVDAGTLLAGIVRILDQTLTTDEEGKAVVNEGPFVGLQPPHKTSHANAAYIFREVIASVLITHPHLDHLSGLAINTPIVEASNGPKTVAGLPSAISAMKYHMFNDIIWPNLSDEDGGAGLITYQRLVEGGNPRFGRGESRGYVRACEGLATKCLSVSHGRCKQRYDAESGRHHRIGSTAFAPDQMVISNTRNLSIDQSDGAMYSPARSPHIGSGLRATPSKDTANWGVVESSAFFIRDDNTGREIIIFGDIEPDSISLEPRNKRVWEIAAPKIVNGSLRAIFIECSYNDTVDDETLYGHLCPRHLIAELKVLASKVEEARPDQHQEKGQRRRGRSSKRKRKDSDTADYAREQPVSPHSTRQVTTHLTKPRDNGDVNDKSRMSGGRTNVSTQTPDGGKDDDHDNENDNVPMTDRPQSRRSDAQKQVNIDIDGEPEDDTEHDGETDFSRPSVQWTNLETGPPPLAGFKVFIIHVKDTLMDGPHPSERILEELRAQSDEAGLGCEFHVPFQGEGILI